MARRGRAVMLQGAGSNVGKSMIVAGLCRAARRRGLSVAPFKPQNMSNNAAVTADGGEIGRAQALQAQAAGLPPSTDMNPVLLKPETDVGAQVVLRGRRLATVRARDYAALKPTLLPAALESFERLRAAADLVIVEGAGAASEVNLRAGDIANMGFAAAADAPVALIGDIDRGGVIAQLVGARAVLDPEDAARVEGFLINKFRGDPRLFDDGYAVIAARTGWRGFGVLPWFEQAARLPAEDSEDLAARARALGGRGDGAWAAARLRVAVPQLPRIANFDDLDPLAAAEGVALTMVPRGRAVPGDADLLILPGSKSTRGDLAALRAEGWDVDILAHHRRGGRILGLCGGYQMLGRAVSDPGGVEGAPGDSAGLGLLDVATRMTPEKRLRPIAGAHAASGAAISGYEMHIGETEGDDRARPFLTRADGSPEGAISADGLVVGTYAHGLFAEDGFRAAFVAQMRGRGGAEGAAAGAAAEPPWRARVEATLDALADHLEAHLDVDGLFAIAR